MKFTQIATGAWKGESNAGFTHTLYALGEDGQIYMSNGGKPLKKMAQEPGAEKKQGKPEDNW